MTSASNVLVATTVGTVQCTADRAGGTNTLRMAAFDAAPVSCASPAGIHSARVGGSTQVASSVSTVSTPLAAHASWWSSWVCQSNSVRPDIGNVATEMPSGAQTGG